MYGRPNTISSGRSVATISTAAATVINSRISVVVKVCGRLIMENPPTQWNVGTLFTYMYLVSMLANLKRLSSGLATPLVRTGQGGTG